MKNELKILAHICWIMTCPLIMGFFVCGFIFYTYWYFLDTSLKLDPEMVFFTIFLMYSFAWFSINEEINKRQRSPARIKPTNIKKSID